MPKFAAGVVRFQQEVYPTKRDLFEKLSAGQSPECLFITCSDSRIETGLITQSDPGELFICRNAGNIVPPHTNHTGGMTASIEFAVSVLKVPHIVVCGHSDCGAMKGALAPQNLSQLPHVQEWLSYTRAAVAAVERATPELPPAEKLQRVIEENVILQLQHLKTHPAVAAAIAVGELELHGWVYDIRTGSVLAYNEDRRGFESVADKYAGEIAAHMGAASCQAV